MNRPTATVQRARELVRPHPRVFAGPLDPDRLAERLVEVSEAGYFGAITVLCPVLNLLQARGEAIAWVATGDTVFFPPDLAFRGIDVQAVTVVRVAAGTPGLSSAETLVRSGAFGLVLVDWAGHPHVDEAALGRLAKLAGEKKTSVVFLTRKPEAMASLGAAVSLRLTVAVTDLGEAEVTVAKDKHSGPPSRQRERLDGPFGLY